MIYQNDPEMPKEIQKWGCYFLALLVALQRIFNAIALTHDAVVTFWRLELADQDHDVAADLTIMDAQNLVDDLLGPGRVKYLGKFLPGYKLGPGEFAIEKWGLSTIDRNKNPVYWEHFTLPDYDPWKGGSRTKREGELIGLRVFKVLG